MTAFFFSSSMFILLVVECSGLGGRQCWQRDQHSIEDGQKLLESCSHLPGSLFGEEMKENSLRITWVVAFQEPSSFVKAVAWRSLASMSICLWLRRNV